MRALMLLFLAMGLASVAFLLYTDTQNTSATEDQNLIVLPISLYILVDDVESPNRSISSDRTESELYAILDGMNSIWGQADIYLEPTFVGIVEVPQDVLRSVNAGDFTRFFEGVRDDRFDLPDPSMINGFYARTLGGPNGIVPYGIGSRNYFVMDEPSVFDRRVSSHEVGHILNLHHTHDSTQRLLFPGTNGMTLTEEEITVARYVAQGMLEEFR